MSLLFITITDVITNSSSEVYLVRDPKYGLTWEEILRESNYPFTRDSMIGLLENFFKIPLKNKPVKGYGFDWAGFHDDTWESLEYSDSWRDEDIQELWENFVEENKEAFEKLIDLYQMSISDECLTWEEFIDECKDIEYSESCLAVLGRNGDIYDISQYEEF